MFTPPFVRKVVPCHVGRAHLVADTPLRISADEFVATTESSPDRPWLLNGEIMTEVHRLPPQSRLCAHQGEGAVSGARH